ncbi:MULTISPECIES: hypothetical protein [unclassified Mesorhizobium]|uniref:hypothetical protein n=1 Tax=unclassified Mesorhizobium TaxID=325217 RepID=UPI000FCAD573|nr:MULTISPECIES: hypothetical protein [unclassified Mesorhizobium]RUW00453.1 hypothetical protein EOA49_15455 [Mesorhizobium sp. M1A.F.Ca.IN.020.04.1.1]RUW15817.1 hypothetical protein EOA53_03165 [Mesorhizobium sp. M1A.F.Ca.IN.020.03.1.1]RWG10829.1 MAG: hypothetical protein EOQ58_25790 [Mesorhizobium sp.]RWG28657.1 MAG: hypothetical protein EOQ61_20345 [Mesorhizobium sp.]RWH13197.1 MAG: hypothetical protein EOQ74_15170 [Mesorhizobium sp.]
MAVTINVVGTTSIDETPDLQKDDISLASFQTNHASALAAINAALTADNLTVADDAIEIAGDNSVDITLTNATSPVQSLGFVTLDSNGQNPAPVDGLDSGQQTLDGDGIFLYTDPDNDNVLLGRAGSGTDADPDGQIVFAVYLEEVTDQNSVITGGQLWTVLFEPLAHPDDQDPDDLVALPDTLGVAATGEQNFSFAGAPAGNNLFMAFGNQSNALLVTGTSSSHTVNSSKGGGATTLGTDAQDVRAGKGMYFTYVTGMDPSFLAPNLSHQEATTINDIDFTGVQDSDAASLTIVKLTGGTSVSVKLTAFTTDAEPKGDYFGGLTDDTAVDITHVYINGTEVSFTTSGDGVIVSGVHDGDVIKFETDGDHNRVLVQNAEPAGSNIHFSIGGFSVDNAVTAAVPVGDHLEFYDDGPTIAVADVTDGDYTGGAHGTWTNDPGTDGLGSLSVSFDSFEIDSHGTVTTTATNSSFTDNLDGSFDGSITADFNGDGQDDTVGFTLTLNSDDTYDLTFTTPPTTTTTFSTDQGSLDAGGPDPVRTLTIGSEDVVFSAVKALTATGDIKAFLNASEADIQTNAGYLSPNQMNVSTAGIGLADNLFEGNSIAGIDGATTSGGKVDESFVVDPEGTVSSMTVIINNQTNGGYTPINNTEQLFYRIYFSDGSVSSPVKVEQGDLTVTSKTASFTLGDPDGPNDIDAVQLIMAKGTIKVPTITFTVSTEFSPQDLDLNFTAELFDGDQDSSPDPFTVHVDAA